MTATPLEIYREWERTGSKTRVHVMQIDRGDGSAANRLTLTDKPYYDKGVGGTKYHDTYPAPVQGIKSDLVTDESFDSTRIDDIVLFNGDGRFNSLLSGENIIGHRFTMLRGDQSWSLMETSYPYRFVEAFLGQIKSVSVNVDEIVLGCVPIKYKLDNVIGSIDEPIHYGGSHRNLPAVLVDAGDFKYRFSTKSASYLNSYFDVRDKGVELAHGSDYTRVAEGEPTGWFLTQVDLDSKPDGQLTADSFVNPDREILKAAFRVCVENLVSDYPESDDSFEYITANSAGTCFGDDDAEFYYIDASSNAIRQRTMSTPGEVGTMGASSKSRSISSASGFYTALQAVSANFFCYSDGTNIKPLTLFVDWDIDAGDGGTAFDTTSLLGGAGRCRGFAVIPSLNLLYVLHEDGTVYKLSYTSTDISTATGAKVVLRLKPFDGTDFQDMRFSPDGRYAYFQQSGSYSTIQYACVSEFDLEGSFKIAKSYFAHEFSKYNTETPFSFHIGSSGDKFYLTVRTGVMSSSEVFEFSGISGYLLPAELIRSSYTADQDSFLAGVFYNREVRVGAIISDLVRSVGANYSIGRLGGIFTARLENPNATLEDWVDVYNIDISAFRNRTGDHIRHISTDSAKSKITIRYDKNFTVQNESELASGVTEANKSYYSRPYETATVTNSLTDYIDPEDMILDTFLSQQSEAEDVRDYIADLWSADRQVYTWHTNLSWQTLLSNFGIGSIINVVGDIKHPEFSEDDKVQVIRERINWSKDERELRVFR